MAYNAKLNSGCLSRQVGAVITDRNFSIKAIGWNDVPQGQVPCNLRDVNNLCVNKDCESFSNFEITDVRFTETISALKNLINYDELSGLMFPYCFKDVYNGMTGEKNQVYTRSLHAEENAFLQIVKYGGEGILGGVLFTTASPCELCSKKAYQLGISEIYYIDPYPGISQKHILNFGTKKKPEMKLFYGAIGTAYVKLYSPIISIKDELKMLSNVDCKRIKDYSKLEFGGLCEKVVYKEVVNTITFKTREDVYCVRHVKMQVIGNELKQFNKMIAWTGSSYDGTELVSNVPCKIQNKQVNKAPYVYEIVFDNALKNGDTVEYDLKTSAKDEGHIMIPFFAHLVDTPTEKLKIEVVVPQNTISDVKMVLYADLKMSRIYKDLSSKITTDDDKLGMTHYCFETDDPILNYSYSLEWKFKE
jgi:Deoxycytidylate deaminase